MNTKVSKSKQITPQWKLTKLIKVFELLTEKWEEQNLVSPSNIPTSNTRNSIKQVFQKAFGWLLLFFLIISFVFFQKTKKCLSVIFLVILIFKIMLFYKVTYKKKQDFHWKTPSKRSRYIKLMSRKPCRCIQIYTFQEHHLKESSLHV